MTTRDLTTDDGLRGAVEAVGRPDAWTDNRRHWVGDIAATIEWVRSADETARASREFQQRLWEDNRMAGIGQGNISVSEALGDSKFRRWFAAESLKPLPSTADDRLEYLTTLYESLKERLKPVRRIPHVKIFRVIAALYPEAMTTVAFGGALQKLVDAMGAGRRLDAVERHLWVRNRLDSVLGDAGTEPQAIAERMSLPWILYARFVQPPPDLRTEEQTRPDQESRLAPLPAVRRRRGLTAIKGLFPGVLSSLEFIRDGVTREQLIDFLRASSPEAKVASLGVAINVLQSELGVIRLDSGKYVLTERGEECWNLKIRTTSRIGFSRGFSAPTRRSSSCAIVVRSRHQSLLRR